MAWLRTVFLMVVCGPVAADVLQPLPVAWFTDNGDRQALRELRDMPEASLSEVDRAVLQAANRVGYVENAGCGRGLTGVLISVDGRDGVLTSQHLLAGKVRGMDTCPAWSQTVFYPNLGYRGADGWPAMSAQDLAMALPLTGPPMNLDGTGLFMSPGEDWMIYWLDSPLSDQPMPEGAFGAGKPRGAVALADADPPRGQVVVIGYDSRFAEENGWQFSWQPCRFVRGPWPNEDILYHTCDVSPGASGSLLGSLVDGELVLQGLVTGSMEPFSGTNVPTPASALLWNLGTSIRPVRAALEAMR